MIFIPEKLTEARESKGLNMTDLANLMGLTRQAISGFERGVDKPSYETVLQFCRVLSMPSGFFSSKIGTDVAIDGPIFFRSQQTAKKKDRAISTVKANWVARTFDELAQYLEVPSANLPNFSIEDCEVLEDYDIEHYAFECRKFFGLGNGPISNMTKLLENNGIPIVAIDAANKIGAFSYATNKGYKFIVVDSKATAVRTRFSLAHELGHLVLHTTLSNDFMEDKELFKTIESQADKFASAFLMPADSFVREFVSPKIKAMIDLKGRWRVSIAAMVMRASQLNLINENQKGYLFRQLAPYRKKEPLDDFLERENPAFMNMALTMLSDNAIISNSDIKARLAIPVSDLAQIFGLSEYDFNEHESNVLSFNIKNK